MQRRGFTALSAISAMAVYAVLWLAFALQWRWLSFLDVDAVAPVRGYGLRHPGWVRSWDVVCMIFGPNAFRVVGLMVIVFAVMRRNFRTALFVLATIGVSGVVIEIAKAVADRPRPTAALVYAPLSAFPSGHAVSAMTGVLALLTITAGLLGGAKWLAVLLGVVIVVAVGFGRVALAVHYPSDVLAGWALGYVWFLLCLWAFRPLPLGAGMNTGSAR